MHTLDIDCSKNRQIRNERKICRIVFNQITGTVVQYFFAMSGI
jgi:hypothetical protein